MGKQTLDSKKKGSVQKQTRVCHLVIGTLTLLLLLGCLEQPQSTATPKADSTTIPTDTITLSSTSTSTQYPTQTPAQAVVLSTPTPTQPLQTNRDAGQQAGLTSSDSPEIEAPSPPSKTPTQTVTPPTQTPTPLPQARQNIEPFDPWLLLTPDAAQQAWLASSDLPGIGTTYQEPATTISTKRIDQLSQLAQWGKGDVLQMAYGPDGSQIYVTTKRGIYVYDARSATQIAFQPLWHTSTAMAVSPDGQSIAIGLDTTPPIVAVYNTRTFQPTFTLPFEDDKPPTKLIFEGNGDRLIGIGDWVQAWEISNGYSVLSSSIPTFDQGVPAWQAGRLYAPGSDQFLFVHDGGIQYWGWDRKHSRYRFERQLIWEVAPLDFSAYPGGVTFEVSPDGQWLAMGTIWYDYVKLVDTQTGERQFSFYAWQTSGEATNMERPVVPFDSLVSIDQTIPMLTGPGRYTMDQLRFSPDSSKLAVVSGALDIDVWDIETQEQIILLDDVGDQAAFSPDGETIATRFHHVAQWELPAGTFKNMTLQHIGPITDMAFVPNQDSLAIGAGGGYVYLRENLSGRLTGSLKGYQANDMWMVNPAVQGIEVSADGKRMVIAGTDALTLWEIDANTITRLEPAISSPFGIESLAWSGDENIVAAGGYDAGTYFYALNPTAEMSPDTACTSPEHDAGSPMLFDCGSTCMFFLGGEAFAFDPDKPFALTCTYLDGREQDGLYIWKNSTEVDYILEKIGRLYVSTYSLDGSHFVGVGEQNDQVWLSIYAKQTETEKLERKNQVLLSWTQTWDDSFHLAISADNSLIAVAFDQDSKIQLFETATGDMIQELETSVQPTALAFSIKGKLLAVGSQSGLVQLWGVSE